MKRIIALTGLACAIGFANMGAQPANYVAGKDYRVLDNPKKSAVMLSLCVNSFGMAARIVTSSIHIWKNGQKPKTKTWHFSKPQPR